MAAVSGCNRIAKIEYSCKPLARKAVFQHYGSCGCESGRTNENGFHYEDDG